MEIQNRVKYSVGFDSPCAVHVALGLVCSVLDKYY